MNTSRKRKAKKLLSEDEEVPLVHKKKQGKPNEKGNKEQGQEKNERAKNFSLEECHFLLDLYIKNGHLPNKWPKIHLEYTELFSREYASLQNKFQDLVKRRKKLVISKPTNPNDKPLCLDDLLSSCFINSVSIPKFHNDEREGYNVKDWNNKESCQYWTWKLLKDQQIISTEDGQLTIHNSDAFFLAMTKFNEGHTSELVGNPSQLNTIEDTNPKKNKRKGKETFQLTDDLIAKIDKAMQFDDNESTRRTLPIQIDSPKTLEQRKEKILAEDKERVEQVKQVILPLKEDKKVYMQCMSDWREGYAQWRSAMNRWSSRFDEAVALVDEFYDRDPPTDMEQDDFSEIVQNNRQ